MRFKGTKLSIPEIAKELNFDAIVEGSVLRVGDRVRVTAQLIHAASDHHLWARSFERDFREVLTLQSEVARDIADQVQAELTPLVAERMTHPRPVNPEAYELYLRGRHAWNLASPTSVRESIELFERAAALDPRDARYPGGIADSYLLQVQRLGTLPVIEGMAKVREYSNKALELDPQSSEAHASHAAALVFGDWNLAEARREIERAIALNPGYASAHPVRSVVVAVSGEVDAAIAFTLSSDKRPVYRSAAIACMYARAGDKARSIEQLEKAADPHVSDVLFVGVEPSFRVLANEPRFQALVRRIGVPMPRPDAAVLRR